jgi:AcrR family transcriptional regulator
MTTDPMDEPERGPGAEGRAAAERVTVTLELLWGVGLQWRSREKPARGPKRGLSLDQIVGAAIAIADADGLDALSMRRVARELRVGTMSLYRYVPGKVELLDLMLDAVSDPSEEVAQSQGKDWRGVLEVVARGARDRYLAHPWLLGVNWSRPVLGPRSLAGVEFVIAGLDGLGLTGQERVAVMFMVDSYVTGLARHRLQHAAVIELTGLSDEEFWSRHLPVLERVMAGGGYPAMAALPEDAFGMSWEDTFEWGLQRLLDGIEALVNSRRS